MAPGTHSVASHKEAHQSQGVEWLEEAVFGSLDGVITSLGLVVTVGAVLALSNHAIFLTVIAAAVAGTLSMFVGAFLSARSTENLIRRERAREEWEVDNVPHVERQEVEELLEFDEDSAAGWMTTEFVSLGVDATVVQAVQALRGFDGDPESVTEIFLLDEKRMLRGAIPLARPFGRHRSNSASPTNRPLRIRSSGFPARTE